MDKQTRIRKDAEVLKAFIKVYCRCHCEEHRDEAVSGDEIASPDALCPECSELLAYALKRNEKCPLDPKPRCKKCPVHCYKPEMRQKIKEVMKFSGIYYLKRGRLDWVYKYFF